MRTLTLAITAAVLLSSTSALARTPTRPEMRQRIQQQYIFSALWEGRIAWGDAKPLLQEQDVVSTRFHRFAHDGALSSPEVKVLDYMLDISSRNIDRALRRQAARAQQPKTREPIVLAMLPRR